MCNRINQEPEVPIATTVAQEEGVAAEGFLVSVREPAHEGAIRLGLWEEWRAKKGGWGGEGNGCARAASNLCHSGPNLLSIGILVLHQYDKSARSGTATRPAARQREAWQCDHHR